MKKKNKKEIDNILKKELKMIVGSFLAVMIIFAGFYYYTTKDANNFGHENVVRDFNYKLGPDSAKVKIVEFLDPECEACRAYFPHVKELVNKYKDDVQLTIRYALYHGNSLLAAKATDAAGLQGKYFEYQELLFLNQGEWGNQRMPATELFLKYAQDLHLDMQKFKMDMEDLRRMETINVDIVDGPKLGVKGTPTFFINGRKLLSASPTILREEVEKIINAK